MFKNEIPDWIIQTASAFELIHSALLIHDDIIDKDQIRRGSQTIFYQYKELGEKDKRQESYHFGESLGICAGDIGFFLAYELLSGLLAESKIKEDIFLQKKEVKRQFYSAQ